MLGIRYDFLLGVREHPGSAGVSLCLISSAGTSIPGAYFILLLLGCGWILTGIACGELCLSRIDGLSVSIGDAEAARGCSAD